MILVPGWTIGLFEILIFFITSFGIKHFFTTLNRLNNIVYYWLSMTILTGIWEFTYLTTYSSIVDTADQLILNSTHVWTIEYDLSYIFPWKLSHIFYAEYGAWADREYMSLNDNWSHSVEGTHLVFCAVFSFFGLLSGFERKTIKSLIVVGMAMAFQLMNSIMYMIEYGIQCNSIHSPNYYNNTEFPLGIAMSERPFMYVNVFWLIMPTYIIFYEIFNQTIIKMNRYNSDKIEIVDNETTSIIKAPPYNDTFNEITNIQYIIPPDYDYKEE